MASLSICHTQGWPHKTHVPCCHVPGVTSLVSRPWVSRPLLSRPLGVTSLVSRPWYHVPWCHVAALVRSLGHTQGLS